MPHKISRRQYDLLRELDLAPTNLTTARAIERLFHGEANDADLDEVAKVCIDYSEFALARELLMPPDQLEEK